MIVSYERVPDWERLAKYGEREIICKSENKKTKKYKAENQGEEENIEKSEYIYVKCVVGKQGKLKLPGYDKFLYSATCTFLWLREHLCIKQEYFLKTTIVIFFEVTNSCGIKDSERGDEVWRSPTWKISYCKRSKWNIRLMETQVGEYFTKKSIYNPIEGSSPNRWLFKTIEMLWSRTCPVIVSFSRLIAKWSSVLVFESHIFLLKYHILLHVHLPNWWEKGQISPQKLSHNAVSPCPPVGFQ